jgi:tRNA (guanine-N1)-methyltransferase
VRFDVVSIFPEAFEPARQPLLHQGVLGRALAAGRLEVRAHDLREHARDRHRQVDDAPFGGGSGMVLKAEPIFAAVEAIRPENPGPVILLEPWGEPLTQDLAGLLAQKPGLIIVCGRYEGIDHRVAEGLADREISIGDYVLSGGELPALVLIEVVARLLPGVVGNPESLAADSFRGGRLGYPQYTRPAVFRGMAVPEVLVSGNHTSISKWRRRQSELRAGLKEGRR